MSFENAYSIKFDKTGLSCNEQESEIPAKITLISACDDGVETFGLPNIRKFNFPHIDEHSQNEKRKIPGSVFTSSFLEVAYKNKNDGSSSNADLLKDIRNTCKERKYYKNISNPIPQLSGSRSFNANESFDFFKNDTTGTTTGTKRALLIGINYSKEETKCGGKLSGSHNDVANVEKYLLDKQNFQTENIKVLVDDDDRNHEDPTKDNILKALENLVNKSKSGDTVFVQYSGHGAQSDELHDVDHAEEDGKDEYILPMDVDSSGPIRDNDLHDDFVKKMTRGVSVTCLFDCCHSATVLDLPYILKDDGDRNPQLQGKAQETENTSKSIQSKSACSIDDGSIRTPQPCNRSLLSGYFKDSGSIRLLTNNLVPSLVK